ncbi:MAG: TonB family protein, partial [Pseudomonadales bacterium]
MIALILFALKSCAVLGVALLLTQRNWLPASTRHLILALAIASLPLMLLVGELGQNALAIVPAGLVQDWDIQIEFPNIDWTTLSTATPAVGAAFPGTMAGFLYGLVCVVLLGCWCARVVGTRKWITRTRLLSDGMVSAHASSRRVSLRLSDHIDSPLTWGMFRPDVVVPGDWSNWPDAKRRAVLSHELAHVRRFDSFTTLLSGIICCLFWMNPLVWVAHRRMLLEAEFACDDIVVNEGVAPTFYASQLLEIARTRKLGLAMAMATAPTLPKRIRAILDSDIRRTAMNVKRLGLVVTLALAVVLPIGSISAVDVDNVGLKPTEIVFRSDGDLMPIVKVAPVYPSDAQERLIEGYAVVEFVVTETGSVANPVIVESDPPGVFDKAALAAVVKFKYKPRVVDGQPVEVSGVRNNIVFELEPVDESSTASTPKNMSESTFDALAAVQQFLDARNYEAALGRLDAIQAEPGLNGNEIGQIHNMRGFVYFSMEDYVRAIDEYDAVIAQAEYIPKGLQTVTLYTLAQLSFVTERYQKALDYMQAWIAAADNPGPAPFIFMGQVFYQMNNYPAAIDRIEDGIRVAK